MLLEGYYEFLTHRALMVDMPTHLGRLNKVPLDGVVSFLHSEDRRVGNGI